jgi:hypothetical protein
MQGQDVKQWVGESSMAAEYDAELGDARRTRRARRAGAAISMKPELSFPKIFADEGELEGFYRLVENEEVEWRSLADAHAERTSARAKEFGDVLVVHDTTDIRFRTYWPEQIRKGLTAFSGGRHGLLAHTSLAVTATGTVLPLGVLDVQPFVHQKDLPKGDAATKAFWVGEGGLFETESERWFRGVDEAERRLRGVGARAVHVMDREADSFGLLHWMQQEEARFVVRCSRRRPQVRDLTTIGTIHVQLGEVRPGTKKEAKSHPARRRRPALLTIRAGKVVLTRQGNSSAGWAPTSWDSLPKSIELNWVEAVELHPPGGEKAVHWRLLTTEPTHTAEQAMHVVNIYRRRWLIEEYFKALKSGCGLEQRQADSAPVVLRVLTLLIPAAWRLLVLRRLADEEPELSWHCLLTRTEFRLLQRAVPKAKLGSTATVQQCMLAVAKLGGHLPRNGRPGWQSLYAGWQRLEDFSLGARLSKGDEINP